METLIAYHGKEEIKKKYVDRVRAHRMADQLIQRKTWDEDEQRGCAVGCTLHQYSHSAYETELGIPRILARLEDGIFEGLSVSDSRTWPENFLKAIQPGSDLSMIWPKFAHWLLVDQKEGVISHAKKESTKKSIVAVADLYARWIAGAKPSDREWRAYAAYAAADAAAAAAAAAAYAAAAVYARKQARLRQSEKLIELLKEAK